MLEYGVESITLLVGTAMLFLPVPHNYVIGFVLLAAALVMAILLYIRDRRPARAVGSIEGEVYRVAFNPKSPMYEFTKSVFTVAGGEQPPIDTDVLVELYIVNTSKKSVFIRDFTFSMEVDGQMNALERRDDLLAEEFQGVPYEYALNRSGHDLNVDLEGLTNLSSAIHSEMKPGEPLEGWIRFLAKNIIPDKLNANSIRVGIVDSLGTVHPIRKKSEKSRGGVITVRRVQDTKRT